MESDNHYLSQHDADEILKLINQGYAERYIRQKTGISRATISLIRHGKWEPSSRSRPGYKPRYLEDYIPPTDRQSTARAKALEAYNSNRDKPNSRYRESSCKSPYLQHCTDNFISSLVYKFKGILAEEAGLYTPPYE